MTDSIQHYAKNGPTRRQSQRPRLSRLLLRRSRASRSRGSSLTLGKEMPTERQILYGLLRFGAAEPKEKARIMSEYLAMSRTRGGGPHVWNPDVEIVESLSRVSRFATGDKAADVALASIQRDAEVLLEVQTAIVDRSAFASPQGIALQGKCGEALIVLGPEQENALPFFDLMCHTCD